MQNAHYHTFHTSYVFYWLQSLLNYYDYTGDRAVIDEVAPEVHAMLDQYTTYLGKNGIISEAPNYMFHGLGHRPRRKGSEDCLSLPSSSLRDRAGLHDGTFLSRSSRRHPGRATDRGPGASRSIFPATRAGCVSVSSGALGRSAGGNTGMAKPFVTSVKPGKWLPADVPMESFSVQNNTFAVLYDVAPPAQWPAILGGMLKNPNWDVTPFFMHFVFEALAKGGLFGSEAVSKMHDYVVVPETQTVREAGPNKGDYSHGWIASPTYQMSSKILGITPASPGFDVINIQPTFCDLAFARGAVPSRHGLIGVDWTRQPDQLSIKLDIPAGTHANVNLPIGHAPNAQLLLAGRPLAPSSMGTAGTESGVHFDPARGRLDQIPNRSRTL